MDERLLGYYAGDEFCASVWKGKYAADGEITPNGMHLRMAEELAEIEVHYRNVGRPLGIREKLSEKGKYWFDYAIGNREIWEYLDRYKKIIPQGSIMSMLGNKKAIGSLSNCFVIPSPVDSYAGVMYTDQQIAQLEKRRGGVGTNLNTLRPEGVGVKNAAGTSTGAHSFMDRFSNTTREVAQNGRRGALMLLMDCRHPDIFKFVSKKADLTKVTGANISVQLTDKFMQAVKQNTDFLCSFPVERGYHSDPNMEAMEYNVMSTWSSSKGDTSIMRIRAKELYDLIIEMAWSNGEPGVAFMDTIIDYSPEGVYDQYRPTASNPCGEQWMQAYDACRLLALNLFGAVKNPYTSSASIDYDTLYDMAYMQQRLADNIVDLEIQYIDRIIRKIHSDPEPEYIKQTELVLWENIRAVAGASRRTGCGFTAMADTLAALGIKYDSDEAIDTVGKICHTKMKAELDCTIDLSILRGSFKGWDTDREFHGGGAGCYSVASEDDFKGDNKFYQMLCDEFPEQVKRMMKYGRRNVSWSTVAPTGTVSIVALLEKYPNTSAGVEPQFACYYFRNKKVNPGDTNVRVDFVDQNGDSWMTYPVVMGGLKEWIEKNHNIANFIGVDNLPKEVLEELFKKSPYYGSCANDINWEKRIRMQSIVQKYTTNAISSTLNLPKETSKEVVAQIYEEAWKRGLKGVTIYRDGCRTGVLTTEATKNSNSFEYRDATKRPKELESELSIVTVKGVKYGVVVGIMDNKPYEIFGFKAFERMEKWSDCTGKTVKVKKGHYRFVCEGATVVDNLQDLAIHNDELVLTRLISGMLRHGAKPQFVMEQIDKCDLEVVSFGKAISRVLKKHCKEEELINRNKCKDCGSSDLRMQEGCLVCNSCGNSKCG